MSGADYVANVRLYNAEQQLVADVGQTCERVAPHSLGWLERDGLIVRRAGTEAGHFGDFGKATKVRLHGRERVVPDSPADAEDKE